MRDYRLPPHWLNTTLKLVFIGALLTSITFMNFEPKAKTTPIIAAPWTLIPINQQTLTTHISDKKINGIIQTALSTITEAKLTHYSVIDEPITQTPFFSPENPNQSIKKFSMNLVIGYHDLSQLISTLNQNPNILWKELQYDAEKYPHNTTRLVFYFF